FISRTTRYFSRNADHAEWSMCAVEAGSLALQRGHKSLPGASRPSIEPKPNSGKIKARSRKRWSAHLTKRAATAARAPGIDPTLRFAQRIQIPPQTHPGISAVPRFMLSAIAGAHKSQVFEAAPEAGRLWRLRRCRMGNFTL